MAIRSGHHRLCGTSVHLDFGCQETMRKATHDQERRIGEHGNQGQQHARSDGHKHVICGKAIIAERPINSWLQK